MDTPRTLAFFLGTLTGCSLSPGSSSPFGGSEGAQDGGTASDAGNDAATGSDPTNDLTGDATSEATDTSAPGSSGVDPSSPAGSEASSGGDGSDETDWGEAGDTENFDEAGEVGAAEEKDSEVCGDGVIELFEDCEDDDLGGATCESFGFLGGELACDASACWFDFAGCTGLASCGDGVVDFDLGEECDGEVPDGLTCESDGFAGGTLACDPFSCYVDYSQCKG